MRALLALTVAMGVLILVGSTALVALLIKRSEAPAPPSASAYSVTLDEPVGTHITSLTTLGDRMAVQLQGGGPDRVLLVDPRTGGVTGRIALQK